MLQKSPLLAAFWSSPFLYVDNTSLSHSPLFSFSISFIASVALKGYPFPAVASLIYSNICSSYIYIYILMKIERDRERRSHFSLLLSNTTSHQAHGLRAFKWINETVIHNFQSRTKTSSEMCLANLKMACSWPAFFPLIPYSPWPARSKLNEWTNISRRCVYEREGRRLWIYKWKKDYKFGSWSSSYCFA